MMDDMEFHERQEINDIEAEEDKNGFKTLGAVEDDDYNIDDGDTEDE